MQDLRTIIFDSGRFPLWFRVPALLFGLAAIGLAGQIAYGLFGVGPGMPFRGSPVLGFLACLIIGAAWTFVWFAQMRILFDANRVELVVRTSGYLRPRERRVRLAGCRGFHVRRVCTGIASRTWRLTAEFEGGRTEWIADVSTDAKSLAEPLQAATRLPVITKEGTA